MTVDRSHAADLHDIADELADILQEALTAAQEYRDRCKAITGDEHQPDDEAYLRARRATIAEAADNIPNSLYSLD
jgi:hypothetical protein